jgi:hypothetical protein
MNTLMAPVKLEGFTRFKDKRNKHLLNDPSLPFAPTLNKPAYAIIATVKALSLELFLEDLHGSPLPFGKLVIHLKLTLKPLNIGSQLGPGLNASLILKSGLIATDDLFDGIFR